MTMTPPSLKPGPYDPSHAYGAYPVPPVSALSRRASVWLWVSAGLLLLISTCCAGSVLILSGVPMSDLKQQDKAGEVPAETWEALAALQQYAGVIAGVTTVLLVLPAAALLVLGFGVRRGQRGATTAAWIVLSVPTGVLVVMLFLSIIGGLQSTQALATLINALPLLLAVALLTRTWLLLRATLRMKDGSDDTPGQPGAMLDDPWEHTL